MPTVHALVEKRLVSYVRQRNVRANGLADRQTDGRTDGQANREIERRGEYIVQS